MKNRARFPGRAWAHVIHAVGQVVVFAKPSRLTALEKALLGQPWQAVREGVDVKLLPQEQDLYVLAQGRARIHKERAMRRRKLKWLWARLEQISAMSLGREELLMKLGAARAKARAAWGLIDIEVAADSRNDPTGRTAQPFGSGGLSASALEKRATRRSARPTSSAPRLGRPRWCRRSSDCGWTIRYGARAAC
jgi:hypothetical protein